tara:strand:+ start:375 stop:797 length:423 start_codon:yes stop_codon:yes gene_type:complete
MSKIIDIEEMRKRLLRQQKEIDEKLKSLEQIEKLADEIGVSNNNFSKTLADSQHTYSNLSIVGACSKIFVENPDKKYSVKEVMSKLREGGREMTDKYYTTISSTLNRLVKRNQLKKKPKGHMMFYQKRKTEEEIFQEMNQ